MAFINLEEEFPSDPPPSGGPVVRGAGSLDDPYFANAFPENVALMLQAAKKKGEPVYWTFNDTKMRIHPDGSLELAQKAIPLDRKIETKIRDALKAALES